MDWGGCQWLQDFSASRVKMALAKVKPAGIHGIAEANLTKVSLALRKLKPVQTVCMVDLRVLLDSTDQCIVILVCC